MLKRWLLIGLAIAFALPASARVYKWTDADGNIHFGDRPHAGAETVQLDHVDEGAAPTGTPRETEAARAAKRQRLIQSMEASRHQREEARAKAKAEVVARKRKCVAARADLSDMQDAAYLYDVGPDGKRRIFSDAERRRAMTEARSKVTKWCR